MDCLEGLKYLPDNSVHSIVTDPPYGLGKEPDVVKVMKSWIEKGYHEVKGKGFMGKEWDKFVPQPIIWKECLRVLKPGGHLLSLAGSRTYDWIVMGLRFAGFEVRDQIMWIYGSGFPKSLNVCKAIDKAAGANREVVGSIARGDVEKAKKNGSGYLADPANRNNSKQFGYGIEEITKPATDDAKKWDGWGTALKPAHEPIVVARKPLIGTVAQNVLDHGAGAINIDGCRVRTVDRITSCSYQDIRNNSYAGQQAVGRDRLDGKQYHQNGLGRFPANIIHDGSDEVLEFFPESKGQQSDVKGTETSSLTKNCYGNMGKIRIATQKRGDSGSAARFFYCAKSSKSERGESNKHPTVKPIKLMRYLVRLVTCPDGIVLDPFGGSGTTALAAKAEGFDFILFEREAEYAEIARNRIGQVAEHICSKEEQSVEMTTRQPATKEQSLANFF